MIERDSELVILLAGSPAGTCSLNESPKVNWVEKHGGLPNYICQIARGIMRGGKMTRSAAIATAVSRVKVWAAGGSKVNADTRAKAAAAVAQWNKLKASAHVHASRTDGSAVLMLSDTAAPAFNTDIVRQAWSSVQSQARAAIRAKSAARAVAGPVDPDDDGDSDFESNYGAGSDASFLFPYSYIRELWTDHIVVEVEDSDGDGGAPNFFSIPYTVTGTQVDFEKPVLVVQEWRPAEPDDLDADGDTDGDTGLTANELELLTDIFTMSSAQRGDIEALAKLGIAHDGSSLDRVISLTRL